MIDQNLASAQLIKKAREAAERSSDRYLATITNTICECYEAHVENNLAMEKAIHNMTKMAEHGH